MLRAFADAVFVPSCAACDAVLDESDPPPFCAGCRASLVANEPACPRCAEPLGVAIGTPCARCVQAPPPQSATIAPWRYGEAIASALRTMKLADRADLARAIAPLVAPFVAALVESAAIDRIVPVPLHWRRLLRRGYNHAELIAHAARGRAIVDDALRRVRSTKPMPGLAASARAANVKGAFEARRDLRGARVLVLDDITTTGATLAAACAAIRDAGADDVIAFAVAKAE
ncbi:MAG TPA: ComF family protein [Kofleriaceae bacterium]|nr:ComF family protein [Kofleriaceae bacterium]